MRTPRVADLASKGLIPQYAQNRIRYLRRIVGIDE